MQIRELSGRQVWLSEHYSPGLSSGLALVQAQRTALVVPPVRWVTTLVLPDEHTALGVFIAAEAEDVVRSLVLAGCEPDRLSPALHVTAPDRPCALPRGAAR